MNIFVKNDSVIIRLKTLIIPVFALFMMVPFGGFADQEDSLLFTPVRKEKALRVKIELKRDYTNRGTTEEATKTIFKTDFQFNWFINLIRLEIPFPDAKKDFSGSLLDPRLGDIKTRIGFKSFRLGLPIGSFLEFTFPTASPPDMGTGKYQLSLGLKSGIKIPPRDTVFRSNVFTFDFQIQQVFSYAGDTSRKDIDYTKFEVNFRYTWKKKLSVKLTAKPVIDWEKSGSTGSVLELEPKWYITRHWSLWILGGIRLWGVPVASTYDNKLSIGTAVEF